jgi:glycosyltransferase involved in cell wall biosynthesis
LRELAREKSRLRKVIRDYRAVERSKFARLQALFNGLGELFSERSGRTDLLPNVEDPKDPDEKQVLRPAGVQDEAFAPPEDPVAQYERWLVRNTPTDTDFAAMRNATAQLARQPLVSIIMPTHNTPEHYLRTAIDSVRNQVYPHWELCIADDNSERSRTKAVLAEYAAADERIKVVYRRETGQIAQASNSALEIATGEFVGFLDHDDVLTRDALYEVVKVANRYVDVDMVYSDEDKLHDNGRLSEPFFKPDWCPDSFLSRMYTCHFGVYRRSLVETIGRLRPDLYGSQDYDLVLRLTELTDRIHHIPKVLYHWRVHASSTAQDSSTKPYATIAAERALNDALIRRREPGVATALPDCPGTYAVRYQIRFPELVSVIIPTRDHGEDVERCLSSIFAKTTYPNFEVIVVDNGSTDPASLATLESWQQRDARVRVIRYDVPFNFSQINNHAVTQSYGAYLLLLNNDTEIITPDWMDAMVEYAQRPSIGAVGALLLYPDGSVQHAGTGINVFPATRTATLVR